MFGGFFFALVGGYGEGGAMGRGELIFLAGSHWEGIIQDYGFMDRI